MYPTQNKRIAPAQQIRLCLMNPKKIKTAPVHQHQSGIETRTPSDSEVTYYSIIVYIRRCTTDCKEYCIIFVAATQAERTFLLAVIFIPN